MTTTLTARPQVQFDPPGGLCDAYRHEDGSITYIVYDDDYAGHANPRDDGGNIATLVQRNDRCIDLDVPDDRIAEAYDRWHHSRQTKHLIDRYIAMFRPDILHFAEYWSAGDSYGWGYVWRPDWETAFLPADPPLSPEAAVRLVDEDDTWMRESAEKAFDAEVDLYRQWAGGEVYGGIHVSVGEPIVRFWDHGAYVDGYREEEDSCWGFLGYDDHREITHQLTNSPITEVLA